LRLRIDSKINSWFRPNHAAFATTLSRPKSSKSPEKYGSNLILYNNFYLSLERFYHFSGIIATLWIESVAAHYRVNDC